MDELINFCFNDGDTEFIGITNIYIYVYMHFIERLKQRENFWITLKN